jgi:replicative DNA helicase
MSDMNFPAPKFDTSFQRAVLKLALAEDFFAAQLVRYLSSDRERIKINIFDTKQLQILFDCIVKSMDKYKTRPSDGQLRQFISEYAPEEQVALLKTYEDILASGTNDDAYYRQHLKAFIQQIKLAIGFSKIKNTWNSNKLETPDVMQSIVDEIRRVEFEDEDILTLEDIDEITNDAKHMLDKLIPTGLAPLDKDLLGGLPRETFVVALGSTNVGKSLFCISLACNAIRTNHKVLHISLEGMRNEALMRYTANLAQVPSRGLMQGDLTPPQKKQLDRIKEYEKNLRIHNMLGFGVTIEDLAAKCREIYKDFKFDMLLVDYSQLLESKQKTEGSRQTQTYVHRALAAMSREFDCVVLSPVQATRGAQK